MTRPDHAPPADEEAERDFAEGLASNLLHCRELGHSWDHYTASYDNKSRTYDRALVCSSCGCTRHQLLDEYGDIIKNGGYRYPEGYLAHGVIGYVGGAVPKRIFRLAAVQRVSTRPAARKKRTSPLKAVE